MTAEILVVFYSQHGSTEALARQIARGVASVDNAIPKIRSVANSGEPQTSGPVAVTPEDLQQCDGMAIGSPTRFGNMAAPLKAFIDSTSGQWFSGALIGKPAAVFTSTASMHGGQESTLLSMMLPLLHHGMIIVGLPYSEPALHSTKTGGGPYGVSHYSGSDGNATLSQHEQQLAQALGRRLAKTALRLKANPIDRL